MFHYVYLSHRAGPSNNLLFMFFSLNIGMPVRPLEETTPELLRSVERRDDLRILPSFSKLLIIN